MPAPKFQGRWKTLRSNIVAELGSPTKSDLQMVDRLVVNLRMADEAMALAEKEPFVEGSTGQLTEHPGFRVAHRCDAQAVSFARQLRLTPFVRSNATSSESDETEEEADPILRARDELAARRAARAA